MVNQSWTKRKIINHWHCYPRGQDDKTRYYVPTSYTLRVKWAFGKVCVTAKARAVHLGLTIKILN